MRNLNNGTSTNGETDVIKNIEPTQILSPRQSNCYSNALESKNQRLKIYLTFSLLILMATSTSPIQLNYQTRLQSFSGQTDQMTAALWAENGFYSDGGGASCCHCGSHADQLTPDPADWRSNHRPDCQLMQLLQILMKEGSVPDSEIASDAARFERMLNRLSAALDDQITGFVESFGFSRDQVALAWIRYFIASAPKIILRPGDLVELIQSLPFNAEFMNSARIALQNVYILVTDAANGGISMEPTTSRIGLTEANQNSEINNRLRVALDGAASTIRPVEYDDATQTTSNCDDSPLCQMCRKRQRDRVLLPCAHLLFCRHCVSGVRRCPRCGVQVLADRAAFLT